MADCIVDQCKECPALFVNARDLYEATKNTSEPIPARVCQLDPTDFRDPGKVLPTEEGPPPDNCPLRKGPIALRLKSTMEPN
jgi:hypothetical protein